MESLKINIQRGGADSYAWHRADSNEDGIANARSNLYAKKKLPWEEKERTGESKRQTWINEVRGVMESEGLNWKQALKEASRRRSLKSETYRTVKQRTTDSYTGRKANTVNCDKCPGKYNKSVARDSNGNIIYRPNAHNVSKALLTQNSAAKLLREYYKKRASLGQYKNNLTGATKGMRQDISKKNRSKPVQTPCPTKEILVNGKNGPYVRRIIDRDHPDFNSCRSNYLYRATPQKFDMTSVDYGNKKSPAYGKRKLYKKKNTN